ncbi:hypothetical protein [Shewanella surugensis]|uniref:Uncharacterized protein n=1 Tax=Shewanella surugensis TaxID=212020 RepID=A0ABT0LA40_9GAMM|nr:hypothetical protein [Shewanella surugensis]MCL1124528.1 hypothetical protein [Shewanella surugensis]
MLKTNLLSQDEEFETYAHHYANASGNHTSVEHFKRISIVRVFKNKQGEMLAGYTLNTRHPIRYFEDVPKTDDQPAFVSQADDVIETGGLWVKNEVSHFYRGVVFLYSLWDMIKSKKRFIVSGAKHPKVAKLQSIIFPNKLYEGPIKNADYVCIFYAKRYYIPIQALLIMNKYWIIDPLKNAVRTFKAKSTA